MAAAEVGGGGTLPVVLVRDLPVDSTLWSAAYPGDASAHGTVLRGWFPRYIQTLSATARSTSHG